MLHLTKLLTACAATGIGTVPAQAAMIVRSGSQSFLILNNIALGKNTTLDTDFETNQLYFFLAVEGWHEGLNLAQVTSWTGMSCSTASQGRPWWPL